MKKISIFSRIVYGLILLSFACWFWSCAVNPVTGKKEFMLVSNADEIRLGEQTDKQVIAQYGIYNDQQVQEYLNEIGQKIVPHTHRPNLNYTFRVIDSDVINAFAVPGGYVYFTRGILAYLNDEAELAGVLGHEIGHIAARHSAKQMSRAQLAQLGMGLGSIFSETFNKYSDLIGTGVGLLFLRFSRDQERQSDDLGVEYSMKAGYDARRMADFFVTLERLSPGQKQGLEGWFSTHPNPSDRVVSVRKQADEWMQKLGNRKFVVNRKRYLQKIEGLVYGPDPRQGFVENHIFYHPELRFQFPVPKSWEVINLPSQIQLVSNKKDAGILFSFSSQESLVAAEEYFLQQSRASRVSSQSRSVNGLPSRRVISRVISQNDTLTVLSYFISKEGKIYVFHGIADRAAFDRYSSIFEKVMTGFRKLSDPKKLRVRPERIHIITVKKDGILRDIFLNAGVPEKRLEEVSILNGMRLDDPVKRGFLLKTIKK